MKILVTGGAGFIGSNIIDVLVDNDYEVHTVDNLSTGKRENVNERAFFHYVDIRSPELNGVFEKVKPDIVIHHAAQIDIQFSLRKPTLDADINVLATISLLELCVKHKVTKIIYASSAAVYGAPKYLSVDEEHPVSPISFYGISKLTPEYYIKVYSELYGLKYTILRYANVFGIRQDPKGEGGVVSIFLNKINSKEPVTIFGDGEQTRDFIYVKDIALANLAAITNGENDTFNISNNKTVSINQLYQCMTRLSSQSVEPIYKNERLGDIKHSCLDNRKAMEKLDWTPHFTLQEGLEETYRYYTEGELACLAEQN